jgi:hypothetical protein
MQRVERVFKRSGDNGLAAGAVLTRVGMKTFPQEASIDLGNCIVFDATEHRLEFGGICAPC